MRATSRREVNFHALPIRFSKTTREQAWVTDTVQPILDHDFHLAPWLGAAQLVHDFTGQCAQVHRLAAAFRIA